MDLRWNTSLLPFVLLAFRFLDGIMSSGRSERVIGLNEFDQSKVKHEKCEYLDLFDENQNMLHGNYLEYVVV
jgi:hypothetical protein